MDDFNLVSAKEAKERTLLVIAQKEREEFSQYFPKICKSISKAIVDGEMSCSFEDIKWKEFPNHIKDKLESLGYIVRAYGGGGRHDQMYTEISWDVDNAIGVQDT